jgi:hypothetical protein
MATTFNVGIVMRLSRTCVALTVSLIGVVAVHGASSAPGTSSPTQKSAIQQSPCESRIGERGVRPFARWRAQISRDAAIEVIRHVHKACRIIDSISQYSSLAPLAPRLKPILRNLQVRVLAPIYRSHPDLEGATLDENLQPRGAGPSTPEGQSAPGHARATQNMPKRFAARTKG